MFDMFDSHIRLLEAMWHNLRVLRALLCHGLQLFRY